MDSEIDKLLANIPEEKNAVIEVRKYKRRALIQTIIIVIIAAACAVGAYLLTSYLMNR